MEKIILFILRLQNFILFKLIEIFSLLYHKYAIVYMFHEIKDCDTVNSEYEVTTKDFEIFIKKISSKNIINCSDLKIKSSKNDAEKVILTFDDGFESIYTAVYPILKKMNIPFTLFVSLSFINKKGYLSEDQLKILSGDELCTIGSHGVDHIYYRTLSKFDCNYQLYQSKRKIEELIKKDVEFFAFPYGDFHSCSLSNILVAKKSSYKYLFSTIPVKISNSPFIKSFFIPRINVTTELIKKMSQD